MQKNNANTFQRTTRLQASFAPIVIDIPSRRGQKKNPLHRCSGSWSRSDQQLVKPADDQKL